MKKILSAILCLTFPLLCSVAGEKAKAEFLYRLTYQLDTVSKRSGEALMALRVGDTASIFYSQAKFERDSLSRLVSSYSEKRAVSDSVRARYGRIYATYYLTKNFESKQLEFVDNVVQRYKYTEQLPAIGWQFTDEKKTVLDYECQKAVCKFGGRTYEAWFAPDIPISDGPWKLHGLPGLILEVYDTQRHYEFAFLGMRDCAGEMAIPVDDCIKTTKYNFLKTKQLSIDDPKAFLKGVEAAMGIKSEGKVPKRFAYQTMEKLTSIKKQ